MIEKLNKKDIIALIYITLLSIIAVVYGFSIIPSPVQEQTIATDQKRVVDIAQLQTSIDDYYQTNKTLPSSLDEITTNTYNTSTLLEKTDPQTKQPYEYTLLDQYTYQLCADFTTDSTKESPDTYDTTVSDYPVYKDQFKHLSGHICFTKREPIPQNPSTYPTIFPCEAGRMCPMMKAADSPTPFPPGGNQ